MSELWVVLLVVAVWLSALVLLAGLCASAKAGDRPPSNQLSRAHTPREQRSANATRVTASRRASRRPLARARH